MAKESVREKEKGEKGKETLAVRVAERDQKPAEEQRQQMHV